MTTTQPKQTIDTGDVVLHIPTNEEWIVACVEGDVLSWCGWPQGWANIADCTLIKKATDSERYDRLVQLSQMQDVDDFRRAHAIIKLRALMLGLK